MSIIAMKQALEALNHWGKDWPVKQQLAKETLQKAIDQAEKQEPFAYLDPGLGAFYWAREYPDGPPPGFEPVYLAGSNKRWVGLTDAEMLMIYGQQHEGKKYSLGRMVEQALKEKNNVS